MSTTSVTTKPQLDAPTANLFLLLANAFKSPSEFTEDEPRLLRETLAASDLDLNAIGLELARQWQLVPTTDRTAALRDYARLFLGPFEIKAAPYASFYLDPEQRLMGTVSQEVARHYAAAGLAPAEGPCDAPDHIVSECEFLYFLAHQFLTTKDATWLQRYHDFRQGHFDPWVADFADTILAVEALHPFYQALAKFCLRIVKP